MSVVFACPSNNAILGFFLKKIVFGSLCPIRRVDHPRNWTYCI
jgi:hypothetical protein